MTNKAKTKTESSGFDLTSLEADKDLANDGVWIPFFGDSELLIAQFQNAKYQAFINLEWKKHRRVLDQEDKNADKLSEKIAIEAAARFLLLDWRKMEVDGKPTDYTWEIGVELMTRIKALKDEVNDQSRKLFNFQKASEEADTENVKS